MDTRFSRAEQGLAARLFATRETLVRVFWRNHVVFATTVRRRTGTRQWDKERLEP